MRFPLTALKRDRSGAIAPTVALSLFALVAAGGLAFDYAHLATLDTELQDAADQSALAAASQLDGQPNAMARATAAAQSLVANRALMANYTTNPAVAMQTPTYYVSYDRVNDTYGAVATTDATAKVVKVAVVGRRVLYAFTLNTTQAPIQAEAVASLGTAICKTPPVMICNPDEPTANVNEKYPFDANALAGDGMLLVTGNAVTAGNFGFLQINDPGANVLKAALGYNSPPGDCSPTDTVATKTGMNASVMDALNTRFDIDTNGSSSCPSGGTCSPSRNSRKDLVKTGAASANCGLGGNKAWQESSNPYAPTTTTPLASGYPDMMGHPRDICHAIGSSLASAVANGCTTASGRIGNGIWDRDAYFRVNYGWNSKATWMSQTGLLATVSRYQVYQWELEHSATADMIQNSSGKSGYSYPVCLAPGITPTATTVDRRRISAALINCKANGANGHSTDMSVLKFVDLFLVEPSVARARTSATDVYVEIIGETTSGGSGSNAGQVVRRDKPYLIR